jgi:glycosyltransferase involved in cell wall biosynthesis
MMRIAVDVRPLQFDAYRDRGAGRFLSSLLSVLQRSDTGFQWLLVYAPDRPAPAIVSGAPAWQLLPLALPFPVQELPATTPHTAPDLEFQFDSAMEAFLLQHQVDLFHQIYPFAWEFYAPRRLRQVRSVATILDVIPLLYKQEYLDPLGQALKESFADRLSAAVYAQRVQTISAASARDIAKFTGIPEAHLDIIYPGVSSDFRPLDRQQVAEELRQLNLTKPFIFSLLGFHHSKNLRRTIQAFARLPRTVRENYQFVILSRLSPDQKQTVESWIASEGLTGDVRLLEGASHEALLALYSGATVVLHAALYEGFGLPVLEGMACGAPVVASDIPVLREIGADAVVYVDPAAPEEIATGVQRVLEDPALQARLRVEGGQRARLFTWERAAQALLRSYRAALAAPLPWTVPQAGRAATVGENVIGRSVSCDCEARSKATFPDAGDCFGPNHVLSGAEGDGPRNDAPRDVFRAEVHAGRGATADENVIARGVFCPEAIFSNAGDCFGPDDGPRNDAPRDVFRAEVEQAPTLLKSARRLRLSFWSPFNPKLSGISDYSESLVAALQQYADVDCYVEGYQPINRPLADTLPFYDARAYPQLAAARPYDANLYQIGNNVLHRYIYRHAMQTPGIITLHDVVLYYLMYHTLIKDGDTKDFWAEVAYSEGPAVAERARREYLQGRANDYELALHRRIVETSLGTVVHSQWAADRIAPVATAPVQVIPMGCTLFPPDGGRFARVARSLLGWPVDSLVMGVFGIMHRVKRVETVVRVYRRLRQQFPHIALVLMGPVDPTAWPLINALQQDPDGTLAEGIHIYPAYASPEMLLTAMLAVDVGVNLRNPTAGETSATLNTMLGMGKPVIVSDIGTYREYPDLCCPKIPTDDAEEQVLYEALLRLVMSPAALRQASAGAWAYSEPNSWDRSAQRYLAFAETVLSS